jgi:lysozyme family protein
MSEFSPAFDFVMQHEDASRSGRVTEDAGGRTRFGIAQRFHPDLPETFFTGPADAALKTAEAILRRDYWQPMRLSVLRDQKLANKLFDMAVNMGIHQAAIYAQCAVNALIIGEQSLRSSTKDDSLNVGTQAPGSPARSDFPRDGVEVLLPATGRDFPPDGVEVLLPATCISEDGVIGPRTLAALNAADPVKLYALLCDWSRRHYQHVAAINPAQAKNLQGWLKRADA